MRSTAITILFLFSACSAQQVVIHSKTAVTPEVSGVDSLQIDSAWRLAKESFPSNPDSAVELADQGRKLAQLADQLLKEQPQSEVRDTVRALESFNEGSDLLNQLSVADSLEAVDLLKSAAIKFEEALTADAFDDEARLWLARVYEILAERFRASNAVHQQLRVLKRLVMWNHDRHDYVALLAAAHEDLNTNESAMTAATLWDRAALIALEDVDIGIRAFPDSTSIFAYYIRASRAFVMADDGQLAMKFLGFAKPWQHTDDHQALIEADSIWLSWDDGNLSARKLFDTLMEESDVNPSKTVDGLDRLLKDIKTSDARMEVLHQKALINYRSGMEESAVELMQKLYAQSPQHQKITEDYAIMTYNLSQKQRQRGDIKGALAYLLQCVALDASIAARAAFDLSLLLRNNLEAAIKYAHLAEKRQDTLSDHEVMALTRFLAELYRKSGDRDRAREYINQLKDLRKAQSATDWNTMKNGQ
ncbi:MAG: hypothetical protein OXE59_02255 [Bacteroidetes bacterium]|nr:hypothetical protein [Bacteroidota bacterium]